MNTVSSEHYKQITVCRSCGSTNLKPIIAFGKAPLSDSLLKKKQLAEPDSIVPLSLVLCPKCSFVQLLETVDP
ncbi:hypothetical protein E4G67_00915 [Candidatus Bathyarchaeota archaeon]|nr:MAG: hypothetical protein E4G67_00915 [Candidatus Bathyarchaeota archaeon]